MPRLTLISIITYFFVIKLKKTIGDEYCNEYMSDLLEDYDDCTLSEDIIPRGNAEAHHLWFNSYSHKHGKSNDPSRRCFCNNAFCHCHNRKLTIVPQDLPLNVIKLDLSANQISDLPNCTFCNYIHLTYLNLSLNSLKYLNNGSFWGLLNLTILDLRFNQLLPTEHTFPVGVFFDLKSLRCLKLNRNVPSKASSEFKYPEKVLSELINLRTLYNDGLYNETFGEHFREIKNLRTLVLGGDNEGSCNIGFLSNISFKNLEQISNLDISYCQILSMEFSKYAFKPLVNLTRLDVSHNDNYGVEELLQALKSVREYNITTLKMNYIGSLLLQPITIDEDIMQCLPNSLRYLEAKGNHFDSIAQGALQLLPTNLTYIDVGDNRLSYGSYFKDLQSMKNLKILKLGEGEYNSAIPTSLFSILGNSQIAKGSQRSAKNESIILYLPPKLLCCYVKVAGLKYTSYELVFNTNNSLETLICRHNYFPPNFGPIYGLSNLKKLYIRDSTFDTIRLPRCQYLLSLRELRLYKNIFKIRVDDNLTQSIRLCLQNLTILDLSSNSLTIIHERVIENLTNLEELLLSQNNLDQLNLTFDKMLHLRTLSLSNNHLSTLPESTRSSIETILQRNNSIRVDLSNNPINCECKNIEFIKWMVNSKAFDFRNKDYMCQYDDSSTKIIKDSYNETLKTVNQMFRPLDSFSCGNDSRIIHDSIYYGCCCFI